MNNCLITVVGLGNVGRTLVSLLLQNKENDFTINILDPSESVQGSFLDLSQASILTDHKLVLNDFNLFENSSFVFHTAGATVKAGQTRNEIVKESLNLTEKIFSDRVFKNEPYIIVVANPVDVVANYLYSVLKVKCKQILSPGTLLDTARLNYYANSKKGIVIGEHGESMVPVMQGNLVKGDLREKTINAAREIKQTQGATFYGVAQCCVKILEVIKANNGSINIPLSIFNSESQVFFSTLTQFNGINFQELDYNLSEEVTTELNKSIVSIKNTYNSSLSN